MLIATEDTDGTYMGKKKLFGIGLGISFCEHYLPLSQRIWASVGQGRVVALDELVRRTSVKENIYGYGF